MNSRLLIIAGTGVGLCILLTVYLIRVWHKDHEPIKVGLVHSLTGPLAITEKPLVDVELMAIDEINKAGGVLGRQIQPIVVDGKSDEKIFQQVTQELLEKENVAVIFGPWRSTTRKLLTPIFEKHNILMFYPAHDEGLSESKNIVYTGSMPNQVVLPALTWCFFNLGKKFYMVATDSLFQRALHDIIAAHLSSLGGELLGADFIDHENEIKGVVDKIAAAQPQVIINILDAEINLPFFKQLRASGITSIKIPTMSFGFSEVELQYLGAIPMIGDYAAWTYFQTIYREENIQFVENFKKRYGKDRVISSNMESAYDGVHVWAHAVNSAQSVATDKVRPQIAKQIYNGPGSVIYFDDALHAWRLAFIGKTRYDGQFNIIWNSKKQIKPLPYPPYKTQQEWDDFVKNWYAHWEEMP